MSLLPSNIECIEDLVGLAETLGAGSVKFNIVQPTARGKRLSERGETVPIPVLLEKARFVDTELASRTSLELFFDLPPAFRPLSRLAGGGCAVCGIQSIIGVIADGHWALCGIGDHRSEMVFGCIGKDMLEAVWNAHPVIVALREGLPQRLEGVCRRCLMRNLCLGACVAQNFYSSESLWGPFWFCEQAEASGLFPLSRTNHPGSQLVEKPIETNWIGIEREAS